MVTVRKARLSDAGGIWTMHVASIRRICRSHYTTEQIAAWSARSKPESYAGVIATREFLVACDGAAVVGFGQLNPATAELEALYVAPGAAAAGVGSRLLERLEAIASGRGVRSLKVCSSLNAVPFYERKGFRRLRAVRHRISETVSLECVEMEKALA